MSSLSHSCHSFDLTFSNPFNALAKSLDSFFRSKALTRTAKVYHGKFSYDLVADTAISTFDNMPRVTSVDSGNCYIGVFENTRYQGQYQILKPGEKAEIAICGSIVISMQPIPVDIFRENAHSPAWFWELTGPMYIWHFSNRYKYA